LLVPNLELGNEPEQPHRRGVIVDDQNVGGGVYGGSILRKSWFDPL